jgi:FixJ family two-component response regulator
VSKPDSVVFVVDDDAAVRESIQSLIRSVGLYVESFASAQDFLRRKPPDVPGCLVLDIRLPGFSGLELQRKLTDASIRIPIVFMTGHGDIPMTVKAMKAGAVEFLTKPFRDQDLLEAVQQALESDRSARRERGLVDDLRERYNALTRREREVMRLVVMGMLNKQIAAELGTSEITVKTQRGQVMQKMGAGSLAGLVRMAERVGVRLPEV